MKSKLVLACAMVLLLAVLFVATRRDRTAPRAVAGPAESSSDARDASADVPSIERSGGHATREPLIGGGEGGAAKRAPPTAAERSLEGFVVDLDGQPVVDARVDCVDVRSTTVLADGRRIQRVEPLADAAPVLTDARGAYRFERVPPTADVRIDASDRRAVAHGRRASDGVRIDVVGTAIEASGVVLGPDGRAVSEASVRQLLAIGALTSLPFVLESPEHEDLPIATTDADGRFTMEGVVAGAGILVAVHGVHGRLASPTPATPQRGLELRFVGSTTIERRLHGVVRDERGAPMPETRVAFAGSETTSDGDGRFELVVPCATGPAAVFRFTASEPLVASRRGWSPAVVADFGSRLMRGDVDDDLVLTLRAAVRAIDGCVLAADGTPAPRCSVLLLDPSIAPALRTSLESLAGRTSASTDDAGRFRIDGLCDRTYSLRVVRHSDLATIDSGPIAAGARVVELRFPAEPERAELSGRLVDFHGRPIGGAQVGVGVEVPAVAGFGWTVATTTTSAADGSFVARPAPRRHAVLFVRLPDEAPRFLPFDESVPDAGHEFVVERHARLVIVPRTGQGALRVELRTADGRVLELGCVGHDGPRKPTVAVTLADVRDVVLEASQAAAELVLIDGERELRRVPLRLDPAVVTRVEL